MHGGLFLASAVCCLCIGLITRPEGSHQVWCVVCDREASTVRSSGPTAGGGGVELVTEIENECG